MTCRPMRPACPRAHSPVGCAIPYTSMRGRRSLELLPLHTIPTCLAASPPMVQRSAHTEQGYHQGKDQMDVTILEHPCCVLLQSHESATFVCRVLSQDLPSRARGVFCVVSLCCSPISRPAPVCCGRGAQSSAVHCGLMCAQGCSRRWRHLLLCLRFNSLA